jgi:hypothetical protein
MVSFFTMRRFAGLLAAQALGLAAVASAGDMTAEEARPSVERVVLLVAHLDEAWSEAKRTSDKDVRRAAKAPRAQVSHAQSLVTKLQTCAGDAGAKLEPRVVWRRIEQEVPRRRAEIALP